MRTSGRGRKTHELGDVKALCEPVQRGVLAEVRRCVVRQIAGMDHWCLRHNIVVRSHRACVSALFLVPTVSEVELGIFASCGEDRGREGDELRQFAEILGGGLNV
jgi:hypothetical protein